MFERIKKWHEQGLWSAAMVAHAVTKGIITAEQYTEVTGMQYQI